MGEARTSSAMLAAVSAAAALLGLLAAPAGAVDRVYWGNFNQNVISFANLDGSGGGNFNTAGATAPLGPQGIAIDLSTNRLYYGNDGANKISFAKLDNSGGGGDLNTSGANTSQPIGVAIDAAAGRIYWANAAGGPAISFARLDGSGGGDLNTTGATTSGGPSCPEGVALDVPAGKIWWANGCNDQISFAKLDGSGGGDLDTGASFAHSPEGPAIDPAAGRIYWGNYNGGSDSFANLNGSGGGVLATPGLDSPEGVALDPASGLLYTAEFSHITFAKLDGTGGYGQVNTTGATPLNGATMPTLLESPRGSGGPTLSGGAKPGSGLQCSQGSWAPDLESAHLYRAPQGFAFSWSRNGGDIPGANSASLSADSAGAYRCTVTASNAAGPGSQSSPPVGIFGLGKLKRNTRNGTARLSVAVGPGSLKLSGKGIAPQRPGAGASKTVSSPGTVKVLIKAKGKAKRKLDRSGKVKVRVKVTYTPTGGTPASQTKTVKLIKTRH